MSTQTRTYQLADGQTITTEPVTMADLKPGDQVLEHGGLLVELGERHLSQSHDHLRDAVIWFEGTIRNPEILPTKPWLFGGIIPLDGSRLSWTVQSAEWVTWHRVSREHSGGQQAAGAGSAR